MILLSVGCRVYGVEVGITRIGFGTNKQRCEGVGNLNKKQFLWFGSSFDVGWFVFGSSLVFNPKEIGTVQRKRILINSLFCIRYFTLHSVPAP